MSRSDSSRFTKRRRHGDSIQIGAPSASDVPSTQASNLSSSAFSRRPSPGNCIPAFTTLCARVFVANFPKLSQDPDIWDPTRKWLKLLPDTMVPKIFAMLHASHPALLSHGFIAANFLQGRSIRLSGDLPGVIETTLRAIARDGVNLRHLELMNFEKYPDTLFASILPDLPSLQTLNLRACSRVAGKTIAAAAKSCTLLKTVNFNYTSVTPASLAPMLIACMDLEVLKVAGIQSWTDANFSKLIPGAIDTPLPNIRTLKLRQTSLSESSLSALIPLCPNLRRLDISFTLARHPPVLPAMIPPLEKLSVTSTSISGTEMLVILPYFRSLKTLSLGALGGGQGSSAAISNSSAMTMSDEILWGMADVLCACTHLENISLVGNTKLGMTRGQERALAKFVRQIGRKCQRLNLAALPSLRSSDLEGLLPHDDDPNPSRLVTLNLDNTKVDDKACISISNCPHLESLSVAGTKFTSDGLFTIIDACPKLTAIDVTSCRGIKVTDRRRFFEAWKESRANS